MVQTHQIIRVQRLRQHDTSSLVPRTIVRAGPRNAPAVTLALREREVVLYAHAQLSERTLGLGA